MHHRPGQNLDATQASSIRATAHLQIEIPDLSSVMKWIACYMALSRVRCLSELRSIGLTSTIRELIDLGPPKGFLVRWVMRPKDVPDDLIALVDLDQQ